MDDDAKKWYKATSDNAITNYKKQFGDDAMKYGHRSDYKVPTGWTTRVVPRTDQTKRTKYDSYFYSPIKSYSFQSMAKVKRFQEFLKETAGDEVKAYKLYKRGKTTRKNKKTPAVNVRKKVRKSEEENEKVLLLSSKSDEEDKDASESEEYEIPDSWKCESEDDEKTNGCNCESEEDEMPDSWKCEDEMPDSWNC